MNRFYKHRWHLILIAVFAIAASGIGMPSSGLAQSTIDSDSSKQATGADAKPIRDIEADSDSRQTAATKSESLSPEQRAQYKESFDYVWKKIRDSYWDPELGGVDWQAAHDELKPGLDTVTTATEAIGVLNDLVSRMQVSHFSIIPKSAYEALGNPDQPGGRGGVTGMDVRIVGEDIVVVVVTPGTPAAEQGIRPGWIVEAVGDVDLTEKLAEAKSELADNPHQRTILASAANSRLRGKIGDEIRVTLRDGENRQLTETLQLVPGRGEKFQFGNLPEFRVWVETGTLEDGIGYFRFNAFMSPIQVMGAYNQFIKKHRDAKGIIVDVRGNGGGSGDIAIGMIGWLMSGEKESMGKVILRNDELNLIVRPRPNPFQGPVAVLIDEMSVSAAEFFASGIKDLTAARLLGTTTAGAVLGSQIEKLPTGDGFQFAAANFISNRTGRTLEGVGVSPHEVVEPERAALLAGKDPAREAAIRWIQSQSR